MATLVTGGTGFVGSNVVKTLAQQGHEVVCFDLTAPSDLQLKYLEPWGDRVVFLQGDLLDQSSLRQTAAYDITKIVHAAIFTGVILEIETGQSRSIVDINVMGTTNALELARGLEIERFLYVSSGAVYGTDHESDETLYEDSACRPHTLYGVTKHVAELLTRRYGELHDFPTVSVRLGGPYGPMERVTGHRANQSLIKEWTGNVVRGESIEVGDRSIHRNFTYVADIAGGICAILDAPSLAYDVYNNSSGEETTLGEVIEVLQEQNSGLQVVNVPSRDEPNGGQKLDVTRLREDVRFVPKFNLASGLRAYVDWRRSNNFTD